MERFTILSAVSLVLLSITVPEAKGETLTGEVLPGERTILNVLDVSFEPIQQGKNVVRVKVQNSGEQERTLGIHIQTNSPNSLGWGTMFTESIPEGEMKTCRFAFKIHGPVTDETTIALGFYDPPENLDRNMFLKRKYVAGDLRRRAEPGPSKPAPPEKAKEVTEAFLSIQKLLGAGRYEELWNCFTSDYMQAEFFGRYEYLGDPKWGRFIWDRSQFLELRPMSVAQRDRVLLLAAARKEGGKDEAWTLEFVEQAGTPKLDWVSGYVSEYQRQQDWKERLLRTMRKHSTGHFDIYFFPDSTAERDIQKIAEQRERGFEKICEFLGKESSERILLVLFEDMDTKHRATGHQGMGAARGRQMIEVYGPEGKLDTYHETTHVLARSLGNPPAIFNEGLAVYMSDRLGAPPLKNLGGGQSSLYARVRELKEKNEWIELKELMTYPQIGPSETRPPVSYAEAGAFVKFLMETYGKDRFLQAYKELRNSPDQQVHQLNRKKLEAIYGLPLEELDRQWHKCFAVPPDAESVDTSSTKSTVLDAPAGSGAQADKGR
jgi:hypothetical protein